MSLKFPRNFFVTPESLANKFGTDYKSLSSLIYPTTDKCYRSFVISKKSGGERKISVPKVALKKIQREISHEFSELYEPKISCHGFQKGRGMRTNASRHVRKKFVFNIDLSDFFGAIHFGRVKNLFLKPPFQYTRAAATVLAQICCHNGSLPQG